MLKTKRTEDGEWAVVGLPFIIAKSPYSPRWGERQEWLICSAIDRDDVLGAGYQSKGHAIGALEKLAAGLRGV